MNKLIMNEKNVKAIEGFLEESEALRGAYFWSPPANSSGRRYMESKRGWDYTEIEENGHVYSFEIIVNCSCANIYVNKFIYKDGIKTNATTLKTILKKHYEAINNAKKIS